MTKFNKDGFHYHGGYLTYGTGRRFVARFKYGGMGLFKTFLVKNFTVEEYFAKLDAGFAPLPILEAKGFVSHNMRKAMRRDGYTVFTRETYRQWFRDHTRRDCSEFFASQDADYAAINEFRP